MKPELIFYQTPYKILLNIPNSTNLYQLSVKTKTAYYYSSKSVHLFVKEGLVKLNRINKRSQKPELTEKGKEICNEIIIILDKLREDKQNENTNSRREDNIS